METDKRQNIQSPVQIDKWSGPFFDDDQQTRAFQGLQFGGGGRKRMDLQGIDPTKLLNPIPEKTTKPVVKEEGPIAQTYVGDYQDDEKESSVSPQEALANLISKPIIHDDPYDPPSKRISNHHSNEHSRNNENQLREFELSKLKAYLIHKHLKSEAHKLDDNQLYETGDRREHLENRENEAKRVRLKDNLSSRQLTDDNYEKGSEDDEEHFHYKSKKARNLSVRHFHGAESNEEDNISENTRRHAYRENDERYRDRDNEEEPERERERERFRVHVHERNDERDEDEENKENKRSKVEKQTGKKRAGKKRAGKKRAGIKRARKRQSIKSPARLRKSTLVSAHNSTKSSTNATYARNVTSKHLKEKDSNKKAVKRWSHSTEHRGGMLEENVANELESYGHPHIMTIGTHDSSDVQKEWNNMNSPGNGYYAGNGVGPARTMEGEYVHFSSHFEGPQAYHPGGLGTHETNDNEVSPPITEDHGLFDDANAGGGGHEDTSVHSLDVSGARADHETAGIIDAIWEHDYDGQHEGKFDAMHVGRGRQHGKHEGVLKFFGHGGDNSALLPSERLEGFADHHWGHGDHAPHRNANGPQGFIGNHEGMSSKHIINYRSQFLYILNHYICSIV